MKKLLLTCGTLLFMTLGMAQNPGAPQAGQVGPQGGQRPQRMTIDQVNAKMQEELKLDADQMKEVAKLMKEGNFPFEELITKTFKLEEHKEAFELLTNKDISKAKLMFVINEDKEA